MGLFEAEERRNQAQLILILSLNAGDAIIALINLLIFLADLMFHLFDFVVEMRNLALILLIGVLLF